MTCDPNVLTVISPDTVGERGFSVNKAAKVTAYGLTNNDIITFQRVRYCRDKPNFGKSDCALITPSDRELRSSIRYQIGTCSPMLTPNRNSLIIPYVGNYIPVVNGNPVDLVVEVEAIDAREFSAKELGIEPCGYQASVPMPISIDNGDCCGSKFMGYIFHPNETRDPDATVEIRDCNGKLWGYAYPSAGDGHTLAIEMCGGDIVGYAVNNSETAPRQLMGC